MKVENSSMYPVRSFMSIDLCSRYRKVICTLRKVKPHIPTNSVIYSGGDQPSRYMCEKKLHKLIELSKQYVISLNPLTELEHILKFFGWSLRLDG